MKLSRIAFILILTLALAVAGCAAGPNPSIHVPDTGGNVAGFWLGLWHGVIAPITFIISLFTSNVHFYDVHNNGWPYNLGFILGFLVVYGGGGSTASCRTKKKK
jgi:hypothetical protein